MKKKYILIVMAAIIALAVLWIGTAGFETVSFPGRADVSVVYDYTIYETGNDGKKVERRIAFEEKLTTEEANRVIEILEGKAYDFYFGSTPSCGFDRDIALIVNGVRFSMACDKCGTLLNWRNMRYVEISAEEREVLEEMFTSRGGKFPCI